MKKLFLILGDQLTLKSSLIDEIDKENDHILMAELQEEATYVAHHKQKIIFVFSAMRHFAQNLRDLGYQVTYVSYSDPDNTGNFTSEVTRWSSLLKVDQFTCMEPGEYRLKQAFEKLKSTLAIPMTIKKDERFITDIDFFKSWAKGKKSLVMEFFYREVRKKTGLLMKDGKPVGGQWNFDKSNRQRWKKGISKPARIQFSPDAITCKVIDFVEKTFPDNFGTTEKFSYAVTRDGALKALDHFIDTCLISFGDFQDIMEVGQPFLFHSILSPYINIGLLTPLECCLKAIEAFNCKKAPINAVEGFVRQIIGWREFIRGIYWTNMPEYAKKNTLRASRSLPSFYWDAKTSMKCISEVVSMTKQYAYSHHIQRLMITGNFANLAGLDVQQVHHWYLAVYADAYEWVELPNTIGMALAADDGIVGTKPYVSSGAYIDRMSNFCKSCSFNVKEKIGPNACPFNYLYWNFMMEHANHYRKNHRMGMVYRNLDKMTPEHQATIKEQAKVFLEHL